MINVDDRPIVNNQSISDLIVSHCQSYAELAEIADADRMNVLSKVFTRDLSYSGRKKVEFQVLILFFFNLFYFF